MSNTPHALIEEFPIDTARIAELSRSDNHFRHLTERYTEVNEAIHRAESNLEPTDQFHESDMRKERLRLKDEILRHLAAST